MTEAFLVDGVRTPIGRYGGALAAVRPDDLAAHAMRCARRPRCRRSTGRRSTTSSSAAPTRPARTTATSPGWRCCSAGLPEHGVRHARSTGCAGPALDAVAIAARPIRAGEADLVVAGGVESMSRAPFVMAKAQSAFARPGDATTRRSAGGSSTREMERRYGTDSMGETAENVAEEHSASAAPTRTRSRSGRRSAPPRRTAGGRLAAEIVAGRPCRPRRGDPVRGRPRRAPAPTTSIESLAALRPAFRDGRHGDGRQLLGRQRRRGRPAGRLGAGGRRGTG